MSSAVGMPGAIAIRSCGVQRAAVYQRRRQSGLWRIKWCGRIWRRGWRGGAWEGVVQALAGCGGRCGLPMPAYRSCAISAFVADQTSSKILI